MSESRDIPIDTMIADLLSELQSWKTLYQNKKPLYFKQQQERIFARLAVLKSHKDQGKETIAEDYFTREDEEALKDHVEADVADDQRQEMLEEMRNELATYYVEASTAGDNAGEYPISESEARDLVDSFDDEEVEERYEEIK